MMRKLSDLRNINWKRREIQRARESEFDAREDMIAEAIRDGVLGPVSWAFNDLLTDADMEMLRGMHISWR
jgi:hypothetical protein